MCFSTCVSTDSFIIDVNGLTQRVDMCLFHLAKPECLNHKSFGSVTTEFVYLASMISYPDNPRVDCIGRSVAPPCAAYLRPLSLYIKMQQIIRYATFQGLRELSRGASCLHGADHEGSESLTETSEETQTFLRHLRCRQSYDRIRRRPRRKTRFKKHQQVWSRELPRHWTRAWDSHLLDTELLVGKWRPDL